MSYSPVLKGRSVIAAVRAALVTSTGLVFRVAGALFLEWMTGLITSFRIAAVKLLAFVAAGILPEIGAE